MALYFVVTMAISLLSFFAVLRLWPFFPGTQFENSSEIGVFAVLTSAYCFTPLDNPQFYSAFEAELSDHIPVFQATVAGTKVVGRLCAGFPIPVWILFIPLRRQRKRIARTPHHHRS
jgi:hypothetical protein